MMPPAVPIVLKIPMPVFTAGPCTMSGILQAWRYCYACFLPDCMLLRDACRQGSSASTSTRTCMQRTPKFMLLQILLKRWLSSAMRECNRRRLLSHQLVAGPPIAKVNAPAITRTP